MKGMVQRNLNILLVEDDAVDVMNIRRAFKRKRISNPLFVAQNGLQALDMLRGGFDTMPTLPEKRRVVLLDLNMPRMDGLEFLEELRGDPSLKETPVVVLTTSDDGQDRRRAYEFNVAGYILKPVTFDQFANTMEALTRYWSLCEMP